MAYCSNCGNNLPEGAKFCSRCGAAQRNVISVPVAVPVEAAPQVPAAEPMVAPATVPEVNTHTAEPAAEAPEVTQGAPAYEQAEEPFYTQAPVYTQPAQPYVPPVYNNTGYDAPKPKYKAPKEKVPLFAKKPLGFGKGLLVVILCILLFVSSIGAALIGTIRMATQPEAITELVTGVSLSDIPADLFYLDADQFGEDADLLDVIHADLCNMNPAWEELSTKKLEKYLQEVILPFAAEEINDVIDDIYRGKTSAAVTMKEVSKLLRNSAEYLADLADFELTEELQEAILNDMVSDQVFDMVDMEYLQETYDSVMNIIHWSTSYITMAIFGAIALLCIVLLALLTRCPIRTLGTTGGTLLASSLIPSVINLIPLVLPGVWVSICGGQQFLADILEALMAPVRLIPLAILGGSVALLVIRKILMSIKVRKK